MPPRARSPRATARRLRLAGEPLLTLAPLWQGPGDPTMRVEARTVLRATRLSTGSATLRLRVNRDGVEAEAWGEAADQALATLPALLGEFDDPRGLQPRDRLVHELARRFAGLRMTRGAQLFEVLLPAIIAQKVTALEAHRAYRQLIQRFGEPAPGPLGLRLQPSPAVLAQLPYYAFHPLGIERRRADAIRTAAAAASMLERATLHGATEARRRLLAIPGVGPWTAAETLRLVFGDPDEVSVGDYNLPSLVAWALAGERRAEDSRMLELLEPYRGQRARVVMLIELGGAYPPRRGPRLAPRSIAAI